MHGKKNHKYFIVFWTSDGNVHSWPVGQTRTLKIDRLSFSLLFPRLLFLSARSST